MAFSRYIDNAFVAYPTAKFSLTTLLPIFIHFFPSSSLQASFSRIQDDYNFQGYSVVQVHVHVQNLTTMTITQRKWNSSCEILRLSSSQNKWSNWTWFSYSRWHWCFQKQHTYLKLLIWKQANFIHKRKYDHTFQSISNFVPIESSTNTTSFKDHFILCESSRFISQYILNLP